MLRLLLTCSLLAFGCGHSEEEEHDYENLQECFDDHTTGEGLPIDQAIVTCTLDHTYPGETLDFATAEECVDYVDANLDEESATLEEIEAACDLYIEEA